MTTIGLVGVEITIHHIMAIILGIFAVMLMICLIRAVKGPRVPDRVIAVNMMGTIVMVIIAILAFVLQESYLIDICILYAMISFLAVIVLTKIYTGVYRETMAERSQTKEGILSSPEGSDFASQTREGILSSPEGSDFASQNKGGLDDAD